MSRRAVSLLLAASVGGCGGASAPPQRVQAPSPSASHEPAPLELRSDDEVGALAPGAHPSPIPIEADDPTWGSSIAPVTVVVYLDLECPYCANGYRTIRELQDEYGPERLRVVYKHYPLPFHPQAVPAAVVAQAVYQLGGSDAFEAFISRVFAHRRFTQEQLEEWALERGVGHAELRQVLEHPNTLQRVQYDARHAERIGVTGTPYFWINGKALAGAQPTSLFRQTIQHELDRTRALSAEGTSPDQIYGARVAENMGLVAQRKVANPEQEKLKNEELSGLLEPGPKNPSRGPKSAPVTIQVFAEFQCPYCARSAQTLRDLEARYGDRIQIVWRNLPLAFHDNARLAAAAAMEAHAQGGSAAFWQMHDALFAAYDAGGRPKLDREGLVSVATQLRLDIKRFNAALDDARHAEVIDRDSLVAEAAGIRGTPGFMINGVRVTGARPLAEFEQIVDRALAEVGSGN